jgi:hypothetical protein
LQNGRYKGEERQEAENEYPKKKDDLQQQFQELHHDQDDEYELVMKSNDVGSWGCLNTWLMDDVCDVRPGVWFMVAVVRISCVVVHVE